MRDTVAVEEVDGRTLLDDNDMGDKHQALLVDGDVLRWGGKGLASNGFYIDDRFTVDSGNLAMNGARKGRRGKHCHNCDARESDFFHVFLLA